MNRGRNKNILPKPNQADVLHSLSALNKAIELRQQGELSKALLVAEEAFQALASSCENADFAKLQAELGLINYRLGHLEKASTYYNDSLATYRRIGDDRGVIGMLNNLALIQKNNCQWDQAIALQDKAITLAESIESEDRLTGLFLNRGIILTKTGKLDEARSYLSKAMLLAQKANNSLRETKLHLVLGKLETAALNFEVAGEHLRQAKKLALAGNLVREIIIAEEYIGDLLLAQGHCDSAMNCINAGLEMCDDEKTMSDLVGELLRRKGQAYLAAGYLDKAIETSRKAIAICEQCGELYEIGFCQQTIGKAFGAQNNLSLSRQYSRQAVSTFNSQKLSHLSCEVVLECGQACLESSDEELLQVLKKDLNTLRTEFQGNHAVPTLCRILEMLVEVQIRLGKLSDALLSVYELEEILQSRNCPSSLQVISTLKTRIEVGSSYGNQESQTVGSGAARDFNVFPKQNSNFADCLETFLGVAMARVGVDFGFISQTDLSGDSQQISACRGLDYAQCLKFMLRYEQEQPNNKAKQACFIGGTKESSEKGLFLPIVLENSELGLLFLGTHKGSVAKFNQAALNFLTTYSGFLALYISEQSSEIKGSDFQQSVKQIPGFENIVTRNKEMLEMLKVLRVVAPSDLLVLLTGETGTGKGLFAKAIHGLSSRAQESFVAINCAAIPENLLESELFGHKKGSFTGADRDKEGLLTSADGGTIFLDEIGKMPLSMQGKLLHFLDSQTIRPVGSNNERKIDVRVIAASKTKLESLVEQGKFLEDLYYRLLEFPVVIPPLRERLDDIKPLAFHFLRRLNLEMGTSCSSIAQRVLDLMSLHSWPGNVRELEKILKRALVLSGDNKILSHDDLPEYLANPEGLQPDKYSIAPLKETISDFESTEITRVLDLTSGNKSQTARLLQVSYPCLLKKIRHYGLASNL